MLATLAPKQNPNPQLLLCHHTSVDHTPPVRPNDPTKRTSLVTHIVLVQRQLQTRLRPTARTEYDPRLNISSRHRR
jgi:hypothetical protein